MELKIAKRRSLPAEVLTQTIAALGLRGSGKTNTAGVFVEEALDVGQPVVIIDPTDVWWGLQSSADGKKQGYPITILGGQHGQLPLAENDGKVIAQFQVEQQASMVLSLRHLRKDAQRRFVKDLAEELYFLKGKNENRQPLTVVIDEAPLFVPQSVPADMAHVVGAIEDLVARGRSSGFGMLLISQRAATINKNVLSQADTIITHQLTSPHDKKALREWIEDNASIEQSAKVLESVAKLQAGEAWLWAPRLGIFEQLQIRLKRTFDSSATPKMGQQLAKPTKVAEVDLAGLQSKLAAAIEKAKADDPKLLRQRIKELEKEVGNSKANKEQEDRIKTLTAGYQQLREELTRVHNLAEQMTNGRVDRGPVAVVSLPEKRNPTPNHPAPRLPAPSCPPPPASDNGSAKLSGAVFALSKAARKCLTAFYWLREETVTLETLAFYTGYRATSGGVTEALADLRTAGLIQGWRITATGVGVIKDTAGERPSGSDRRDWLRPKLSRCANTLLDKLLEIYPQRSEFNDLCEWSGYKPTSGGVTEALADLRKIGAIEGGVRGGLVASATLSDD
jgi:hypothetical protein